MNRLEFLLLRDRGPAAPAQDEMGWPLFLMRKDLSYTPTVAKWLPRENFCWCSRPLLPHPPSTHLFISIPPTQPAASPPPRQFSRVQRSFCLGGKVTRPRLQSKVHSTPSLGHQYRGHMKGCSQWRQQNESRRSFIISTLFKIFF